MRRLENDSRRHLVQNVIYCSTFSDTRPTNRESLGSTTRALVDVADLSVACRLEYVWAVKDY